MSPIVSIWGIFQALKGSFIYSPWTDLTEFNFKFVRDVIVVLVTCKYEDDPIKNEGARVFTR